MTLRLFRKKIQNILFRYRATPLTCGKSSAELYLHRPLRISLDAIFPHKLQPTEIIKPECRSLQVGEKVQARFYKNNQQVWQFGEIQKKLGTRHYIVVLDSGRVIKRHINQLRATLVTKPKRSVTFGPCETFEIPRIPIALQNQPDPQPIEEPYTQAVPEPAAIPEQAAVPEPAVQPGPATGPGQRPQRNRRPPARFGDIVKNKGQYCGH